MTDAQLDLIDLALARGALRFGRFTLKSGRVSPYFFNAGLFSDGEAASILGRCYADVLLQSGIKFDMLFGPAYKGIPLVTATAIALADRHRRNVPYAFNRKEAKEHGEGGNIVGAALAGRIVIVDDVVSAGTAKRGGDPTRARPRGARSWHALGGPGTGGRARHPLREHSHPCEPSRGLGEARDWPHCRF